MSWNEIFALPTCNAFNSVMNYQSQQLSDIPVPLTAGYSILICWPDARGGGGGGGGGVGGGREEGGSRPTGVHCLIQQSCLIQAFFFVQGELAI